MDSDSERINRYLARRGVASRRSADRLILEGRVAVNGVVLAEPGVLVGAGDVVTVDGQVVDQPGVHTYLALHKPAGYVTTMFDPGGRPTVRQLLPDTAGLHPVGRLDRDTEGLIIATTDGKLTNRLMHPRFRHEKEYRAWSEPPPDERTVERLLTGLDLDDGPARADRARLAGPSVILVLHEGRKRQVRRMLTAIGHEVTRLVRLRVGPIRLGELRPGEWRELTGEELERLGVRPRR